MSLSNETIRLKFRNNIYLPLTRDLRRKQLHSIDFTIISNNCWSGTIYESYGIKKMSPTVGMFIMPEDYLKFISRLDDYLSIPLEFIDPEESKWETKLCHKSNWKTYLIGRLDDIELQMLHYHDKNITIRKWNDRVQRVNRDKLIFKFNDQNGATQEQIKEYMEMPLKNKLCFVAQPGMKVNDQVILVKQKGSGEEGIKASFEPFGKSKYIDITHYLNTI